MGDVDEFEKVVADAIRQEWARGEVRGVAAVVALANRYHTGKLPKVRAALEAVKAAMTEGEVREFSEALVAFRAEAEALVGHRTVGEFMADYRTAQA